MVTAGFAKEVEDVNQYPAVINRATPIATLEAFSRKCSIVSISPAVAIISLNNKGN